MACRVERKRGGVYLREDLGDLADYDQVGRSLRRLMAKGKLLEIGYGLYARATRSLNASSEGWLGVDPGCSG